MHRGGVKQLHMRDLQSGGSDLQGSYRHDAKNY